MAEAVVVASCPEIHHDEVAAACRQVGFQKAFGKLGDMVDSLSGKDWVAKWEAKVVMATVTKAETLGTARAKILCLQGGKYCDQEFQRQPALVRAIKTEMRDETFRVSVEWLEIEDFRDLVSRVLSEAGGKDKDKGKGKGTDSTIRSASDKHHAQEGLAKGKSKGTGTSREQKEKAFDKGSHQGQGKGLHKGETVFENTHTHTHTSTKVATVTSRRNDFECPVCDKVFSNPRALEQHQEDTEHFACPACGRTFSTFFSMLQHGVATGHIA